MSSWRSLILLFWFQKEERVLNRFCKFSLSIAFTIFLTGSWVTAQEASQKVPTQTSRLNVRKIGVASMLNSKGPAAEAFAASKLGANGERSALVKCMLKLTNGAGSWLGGDSGQRLYRRVYRRSRPYP